MNFSILLLSLSFVVCFFTVGFCFRRSWRTVFVVFIISWASWRSVSVIPFLTSVVIALRFSLLWCSLIIVLYFRSISVSVFLLIIIGRLFLLRSVRAVAFIVAVASALVLSVALTWATLIGLVLVVVRLFFRTFVSSRCSSFCFSLFRSIVSVFSSVGVLIITRFSFFSFWRSCSCRIESSSLVQASL